MARRDEHPVDKFVRLAAAAMREKNPGHRRVLRRAAARAKLDAQAWMAADERVRRPRP